MAKKIYGQSMYLKEPRFPSYGGDYLDGSSYALDQSYAVDTDQHVYQTKMAIQELEKQYNQARMNYNYATHEYEHMKRHVELALEAPTQQELDDYPGLKLAWDNYIIVRKLIIGEE